MHGTIHFVSAADCLELRPLVQGMLDKQNRTTPFGKHNADLDYDELAAAGRDAFADGPLTPKAFGLALAERFPHHDANHLYNSVRTMPPLVQLPPRGMWKGPAAQNYEMAERWLGAPLSVRPDIHELVRRYLRAFGPATAADVTTWSRITGMREVLVAMEDELVTYEDESGRRLVDLEGLDLADPDLPAPVRLLGEYDNLFLSHADRPRIVDADNKSAWMGPNGGTARTIFIDGRLEARGRLVDGRIELETFRKLTRSEQQQLDAEVTALDTFLSR